MSKTFGACMEISMSDLIVSTMINKNCTTISIEDIYNTYIKIKNKMNTKKIYGIVLFSNVYLNEFKHDNNEQFYVNDQMVSLKSDYDINWLIKNFASYMSIDKMQLLDLITNDNEKTK